MAEFRDELLAIRERWHCKNHPFYVALHEGRLELAAMGRMMAQHHHHVRRAMRSFPVSYARCPDDHWEAATFLLENLAEEAGIVGLHGSADGHDHTELIMAFCARAGLSREQVEATEPLPAWRARTSWSVQVANEEPTILYLAMLSCLEGQEVDIHNMRTIPGLTERYGFAIEDPAIRFFTEHAEADVEHSRRQLLIVDKFVTTPDLQSRARMLAERAVRLRWAGFSELYRTDVLGERDPLPPGMD